MDYEISEARFHLELAQGAIRRLKDQDPEGEQLKALDELGRAVEMLIRTTEKLIARR